LRPSCPTLAEPVNQHYCERIETQWDGAATDILAGITGHAAIHPCRGPFGERRADHRRYRGFTGARRSPHLRTLMPFVILIGKADDVTPNCATDQVVSWPR